MWIVPSFRHRMKNSLRVDVKKAVTHYKIKCNNWFLTSLRSMVVAIRRLSIFKSLAVYIFDRTFFFLLTFFRLVFLVDHLKWYFGFHFPLTARLLRTSPFSLLCSFQSNLIVYDVWCYDKWFCSNSIPLRYSPNCNFPLFTWSSLYISLAGIYKSSFFVDYRSITVNYFIINKHAIVTSRINESVLRISDVKLKINCVISWAGKAFFRAEWPLPEILPTILKEKERKKDW